MMLKKWWCEEKASNLEQVRESPTRTRIHGEHPKRARIHGKVSFFQVSLEFLSFWLSWYIIYIIYIYTPRPPPMNISKKNTVTRIIYIFSRGVDPSNVLVDLLMRAKSWKSTVVDVGELDFVGGGVWPLFFVPTHAICGMIIRVDTVSGQNDNDDRCNRKGSNF